MAEGLLVALGGHALLAPGAGPALAGVSLEAQASALEASLAPIARLAAAGDPLLITHGNGPQVGHALERVEAARGRAYPLPLHVCVAQTQAEIGLLVATALEAHLAALGSRRRVVCVVTRVEVSADDPRLAQPVKPLGLDGRRRAASPRPLRVLEAGALRALLAAGDVVVAGGGGGVPVARRGERWHGVEAVVDKDATSTLLALALGFARILNLTGVDAVRHPYRQPGEQALRRLDAPEARRLLAAGAFEAGSMAPKIEAAADFVEAGGRSVDITTPALAEQALAGRAGTRIGAAP